MEKGREKSNIFTYLSLIPISKTEKKKDTYREREHESFNMNFAWMRTDISVWNRKEMYE